VTYTVWNELLYSTFLFIT